MGRMTGEMKEDTHIVPKPDCKLHEVNFASILINLLNLQGIYYVLFSLK